ncbi:MAG: hypothetical protein ACTSQJ_09430 [Promethearchaeota archaeon]
MNNRSIQNSGHKKNLLQSVLNSIKTIGNLSGIILAYRDGTIIFDIVKEDFEKNEFTAMCASVIGSAEVIGQTIGEKKIEKIIAELGTQSIILKSCNKRIFLILILKSESKINKILNSFQEYTQKILELF